MAVCETREKKSEKLLLPRRAISNSYVIFPVTGDVTTRGLISLKQLSMII